MVMKVILKRKLKKLLNDYKNFQNLKLLLIKFIYNKDIQNEFQK